MTITRTAQGYSCSAMVGEGAAAYLFTRQYIGYTKSEATHAFKAELATRGQGK